MILRLAINTAQTGRIFQDNTHIFLVCEKPSLSDWSDADYLLNVNVRDKRGHMCKHFHQLNMILNQNIWKLDKVYVCIFNGLATIHIIMEIQVVMGKLVMQVQDAGSDHQILHVEMYDMRESYPHVYL